MTKFTQVLRAVTLVQYHCDGGITDLFHLIFELLQLRKQTAAELNRSAGLLIMDPHIYTGSANVGHMIPSLYTINDVSLVWLKFGELAKNLFG